MSWLFGPVSRHHPHPIESGIEITASGSPRSPSLSPPAAIDVASAAGDRGRQGRTGRRGLRQQRRSAGQQGQRRARPPSGPPPASAASLSLQTRPAGAPRRGLAGKEPPSGGGVAREGAGAAEWAEGAAAFRSRAPLGRPPLPHPGGSPVGRPSSGVCPVGSSVKWD